MIFRPELVELIKQGKKTQTRRPVKRPGERSRYKEGHVYSVQPGRTKPGELKITITAVRVEPVGLISDADVRREGFKSRADFFTYFQLLYGPAPTKGVRTLMRERRDLEGEGMVDGNVELDALTVSIEESMLARAERLPLRAVPAFAHVISFQRGDLTDEPRLLVGRLPREICMAPTGKIDPRTGRRKPCGRAFKDAQQVCRCGARRPAELNSLDDRGYTSIERQALQNEPEAVPEADQRRITSRAHAIRLQAKQKEWLLSRGKLTEVIDAMRQHDLDKFEAEQLKALEDRRDRLDGKLIRHAA